MERPNSDRATRNDVARVAGLSTAVVSYVLNGGPRPVSEASRARVLKAVQELNYRPNASAKALKLNRSNVIGLIIPDLSNPFFAEFGREVQNAAFRRGYSLILAETNMDAERESAQINALLERQLDGLITFGLQNLDLHHILIGSGIALVSVDDQVSELPVPTVSVDDFQAAQDAVNHLIGHGHSRIGYIGGPEDLLVSQNRRRGWAAAMLAHDPDQDLAQIQHSSPHTREGGYASGLQALDREDRPTALFIGADIQAVGVLHACYELGLQIPEDVAIFSFDGTKEAEYSVPPLSTVAVSTKELADRVLSTLLAETRFPPGYHFVVGHQLIARQSCGCIPRRT